MATRRIGLFGGSFDPIHHGHLITARAAAEALSLERIVLLPSAHPPHKAATDLSAAKHRAAMVRLAVEHEALFGFDAHDLTRPGPTYTVDTVRHFAEQLDPSVSLYWIIGADSLAELSTWSRVSVLMKLCTIVTTARPGWDSSKLDSLRETLTDEQVRSLSENVLNTPHIDICATDIRDRVRRDKSIRFLVPDFVADYVRRNRLYLQSEETKPANTGATEPE